MENEELQNDIQSQEPIAQELEIPTDITKEKYHIGSTIHSFFVIFGIAFLTFFYIFYVYLTPIKVVGTSMSPTINVSVVSESDENHNDIVYYAKSKEYQNDDVVIVYNNGYIKDNSVEFFIKRVIAKPGQTIKFYLTGYNNFTYTYNFTVYKQDGSAVSLDESYVTEDMKITLYEYQAEKDIYPFIIEIFEPLIFPTNQNDELSNRISTITIGENQYFVMGDNRNNSRDSRYCGLIEYKDIEGDVKLHLKYQETLWQAIINKIKSTI